MSILSAETRRMIDLSRAADEPPPARERVVRDRLIAELGVTALAGLAGSTAAIVAAESASATGAAVMAGATSQLATGTSAVQAASGIMTSAAAKTIAGLMLAAGIGATAIVNDAATPHASGWSVAITQDVKVAARRVWQLATQGAAAEASHGRAREREVEPLPRVLERDEERHRLLMNIARRPDHPVAKETELVLILEAEHALSAGDAGRAKRYLDAHEADFSRGPLEGEREALRVLVDCATGARAQARARAQRFAVRFPDSDQLPRLGCAFAASEMESETSPSPTAPLSNAPPKF